MNLNLWDLRDSLKRCIETASASKGTQKDSLLAQAGVIALDIYHMLGDPPFNFAVITGRWTSRPASKKFHVWLQDRGVHLGGESAETFGGAFLQLLYNRKLVKLIQKKEGQKRKPAKRRKIARVRKLAKRRKKE